MEAEGSNGVPLLSRPAVKVGAALVVLAILAVAALRAVAPDNGTDAVLSSAPGFDGGERPADTSPFQMAEPDRQGPTTIPDGLLPTTTQPPITAPPPPPTIPTTLPPPVQVAADNLPCLAVQQVYELFRLTPQSQSDPRALRRLVTDHFRTAADRLRASDASTFSGAITILDRAVEDLADAQTVDAIGSITTPIVTLTGGPEMTAAFEPVLAYARATCPDVVGGSVP